MKSFNHIISQFYHLSSQSFYEIFHPFYPFIRFILLPIILWVPFSFPSFQTCASHQCFNLEMYHCFNLATSYSFIIQSSFQSRIILISHHFNLASFQSRNPFCNLSTFRRRAFNEILWPAISSQSWTPIDLSILHPILLSTSNLSSIHSIHHRRILSIHHISISLS